MIICITLTLVQYKFYLASNGVTLSARECKLTSLCNVNLSTSRDM